MSIWINGTPIADLGLELVQLDRWAASMEYSYMSVALPGARGRMLSGQVSVAPRTVAFAAVLPAASVATRNAALTTVLGRLHGLIELRTADEPDRVLYGVRTREASAGVIESKSFVDTSADLRIPIEITCFDPAKHDRFVQSAAFGAARAVVPVGSLPHGGKLYIAGAATNPVVTYRNMAGDAIATMGFTATLGADDYLVIDLDEPTITRYDAGVASNGLPLWTSGDFFVIDPGDADVESAAYPTLEVTAGSGVLYYHRAWSN